MSVQMRHDSHYVDSIASTSRSIGKTIPVDKISPNPEQPRREIGELSELSNSIKEKGVLEPLLVKGNGDGTYMIIAGERRWRASQIAGLTEVPCIEMDLNEQEIAEIALIENLQRKDLTIWEEADGLRDLAERYGHTREDIAKKISKSRSTVTELMTIAGLPDDIRTRCRANNISSKSALLEVARQFDDAAMHEHLDLIESGKAVSKKKRSSGSEPARVIAETALSPSLFSFTGNESDFTLTLKFGNGKDFSKNEVLKALKEAFEAVKLDPSI